MAFVPSAKYRVHWRVVESCSGVTSAFDAVSWYVTPGSAAGGRDGIAGSYWPKRHRIYLNQAFVDHDELIRHEMLHAILGGEAHEPAFVRECGGLVVCEEECIAEAGGLPPLPTSLSDTIMPSALIVTTQLLPPTIAAPGWSALITRATNPIAEPVWVNLQGRPGIQFECRIDGITCERRFLYGPNYWGPFRASTTRAEANVFELLPGAYSVVGAYNTHAAPAIALNVP